VNFLTLIDVRGPMRIGSTSTGIWTWGCHMATFGWIATGLVVLSLLVFITIEWMRQDLAIVKYWTGKQEETNRRRNR
jgi:hypothetical protein